MLGTGFKLRLLPNTTHSSEPQNNGIVYPFGLYEFNKLPMGISIGCQGMSRVVDNLFADLTGEYVFNYLDDLVVYSASMSEHQEHLREVLGRLQ